MKAAINHLIVITTLFLIWTVSPFSVYGFHRDALDETADDRVVLVFYKEQPPSLQTHSLISDFLKEYSDQYVVEYRLITDPDQKQTIESLGLSTDHLPVAIAINGKTSAMIDGEVIVFANFPDIMHHIGRHPGNWTLEHLQRVLDDNSLLLDDNPLIRNRLGGQRD